MKKGALLCCLSALAVFVLGCWNDPRATTISEIIKEVNQASTHLTTINGELKKAVKKAEKDDSKINKGDLNPTLVKIEKLRDVGGNLAALKAAADTYQSKITPAEQKTFAAQYKERLDKSFARLRYAQEKIRETRARLVKVANDNAVDMFDDALRAAMQEFESVTRQ